MTPTACFTLRSWGCDIVHGLLEGQTQDLGMEVDGVASEVTLRPAPVAVLDDEAGKGGQQEIAASVFEQLEAPLLEQRQERGQSRGTDLFASPARVAGIRLHFALFIQHSAFN